jgi:drug/metabolite transporter (DMT)-like permease
VKISRIAGIALIVGGVLLAYTGYEMSGSIGNQLNEAFSGSPSDSVLVRYVAGAACALAGAFLAK